MAIDWDLREQEMDEHLAADPVLQRAARGEPVSAAELDPWWKRAVVVALLIVMGLSIAFGIGMWLPLP